MVIKLLHLQQSKFRRYAAKVLSPFFIFAVFDDFDFWSVIVPLTGVINYVFCIYSMFIVQWQQCTCQSLCYIASGDEQRRSVAAFFTIRQKAGELLRCSRSSVRPYWLYRNRFLPSQWDQSQRWWRQSAATLSWVTCPDVMWTNPDYDLLIVKK